MPGIYHSNSLKHAPSLPNSQTTDLLFRRSGPVSRALFVPMHFATPQLCLNLENE
jgi:hypothetical protein